MKNIWHIFKTFARFLTLSLLFAAGTFAFTQKTYAQETQTKSCKPTKNLLPDFIKSHPDTYQKLEAQAADTPNHSGLLWKITKPNVKPSYLFGTMHLSDPRISNAPAPVLALLDKAETMIIETTDVMDPAFLLKILNTQPDLIQMQGENRLSKLFSDEEQAEMRERLVKRNLSFAVFDRLQPWIVTNLLSIPQCESVYQAQGEVALDLKLAKRAQDQDKYLVGLETAAEQLEAMKALPMEFHHKGLLASVRALDEIDDFMETLTHLYLSGRIGLMAPLLQALDEDGLDDEDYQKFEAIMVTKRNHNMVERGLTFFNHGDVFMAVGALHLPGDDGLVELLRAQGFTVENVPLN
ncbi:TraB/GumN family protein [Paenochrobactrum pullorum]|uniref:TraB/GumN family protein n=1 Tax=Paenochrobactrum pullorum TaxID=1324351 RepID=UPI0035BBF93C